MKLTLSLLALLNLFHLSSFAQKSLETSSMVGRNSFFAELGGPGILFSANIDHRFTLSRLGWGGRAGIGFVSSENDYTDPSTGYLTYRNVSVLTIPLQINYIFGKGISPHTFEAGAGMTFLGRGVDLFDTYSSRKSSVVGTFSFMYRRQPVDGGFTWRIGFTPVIARSYIQPSGAIGVGYNF